MTQQSWTVKVEQDLDTGDLVLPFTPDMLAQVGWDFGDTLIWEELGDGGWSLKRKDDGADGTTTE